MERLLIYSLERQRPIQLMWQEADGALRQASAQVTAWDGRRVTFVTLRPKRTCCLPVEQLLSADYRKGDEGEG